MNRNRTRTPAEESMLARSIALTRRPKPKYDVAKRTQELIDAIEATSIAARWQMREPITLDLVIARIAKGDAAIALSALRALRHVGVLDDERQDDGALIYRLAEQEGSSRRQGDRN